MFEELKTLTLDHTYYRPHRGLFVTYQVFPLFAYHMILNLLQSQKYDRRIQLDVNFSDLDYPPFSVVDPMSELGGYIIHVVRSDRQMLAEFQPLFQNVRIFINFQDSDAPSRNEKSMSLHYDSVQEDYRQPLLTYVITLTSEELNGKVIFSDRDDGNILVDEHRDTFVHETADNSAYYFNGHYVKHGVMPLSKGWRYSVVFFSSTHQSTRDVMQKWSISPLGKYICLTCCKSFHRAEQFRKHKA